MALNLGGAIESAAHNAVGVIAGGIAADGCSLLNSIYNSTIGGAVDAALGGLYKVLGNVRSATEMVAQMVGVPLAAVKKYFSLQGSGAMGAMNSFMSRFPCGAAADIGNVLKGKSPLGPIKQFNSTGGGSSGFLGSIASQVGLNNLPGFGNRGNNMMNLSQSAPQVSNVLNHINKGVDHMVDSAGSFLSNMF